MRSGSVWRKIRRVVQEILTAEKCFQHLELQKAEASVLMHDMLQNPEVSALTAVTVSS